MVVWCSWRGRSTQEEEARRSQRPLGQHDRWVLQSSSTVRSSTVPLRALDALSTKKPSDLARGTSSARVLGSAAPGPQICVETDLEARKCRKVCPCLAVDDSADDQRLMPATRATSTNAGFLPDLLPDG